ncbi:hypothetical protein [Nocardia salmonicida]|uniref:hypothetical protein n=1 Tax=Nocardia salmonicida TaxID=53431 RepID=UPI0012F4B65E|nr:hypothetical protein [Nocardia salmonicida]
MHCANDLAFREEIEVRTDEVERRSSTRSVPTSTNCSYLDPWSEAIIAGHSYPTRVAGIHNVGGGPHFGSGLTTDTAAQHYENKI